MKQHQNDLGGARARLLELAQSSGASLAGLSELIGRNQTYLQQFIRKGSPRRLEERDRRTLAQFFSVSEVELGAEEEEKSYKSVEASGESGGVWVEVARIDLGASAGPGALVEIENSFDTFRFSQKWLREKGLSDAQLSAITVKGDSMEPLLRDGDEILVDTAPRPFRDGVHVVRMGETLMVKRIAAAAQGRLTLISQNLAYPPIDVAAEEVEIVGRVVWKSGMM